MKRKVSTNMVISVSCETCEVTLLESVSFGEVSLPMEQIENAIAAHKAGGPV